MAFLLRRPFIYVVIAIIAVMLILAYSGVLTPAPASPSFASTTLTSSPIYIGQNTTLTVAIENKAPSSKSVQFRIFCGSPELKFYDKINGTLLSTPYNGTYYVMRYPKTRTMLTGEQWSIAITIKGLDHGSSSVTYTIYLEIYSDNQLYQRKSIQLTVNRQS